MNILSEIALREAEVELREKLQELDIPLDVWHSTVATPQKEPKITLSSIRELGACIDAKNAPHFILFVNSWESSIKEFEFWDAKISVRVSKFCPPDKIIAFSVTDDPMNPWDPMNSWKLEGIILIEPLQEVRNDGM